MRTDSSYYTLKSKVSMLFDDFDLKYLNNFRSTKLSFKRVSKPDT